MQESTNPKDKVKADSGLKNVPKKRKPRKLGGKKGDENIGKSLDEAKAMLGNRVNMQSRFGIGALAGPTMKVEFNGIELTCSVCEHGQPIVECRECDMFGKGSYFIDVSTMRDKLRHPLKWLRMRMWFLFNGVGK